LRWAESESAPPGWDNPLNKVKPPKRPDEVQKPIELETFARLLAACSRTDNGDRDRALLLVLLDTGLRWQEVTDLTIGDVDGEQVFVRRGKGRKSRVVFLSARTRRALTTYLRQRGPLRPDAPLWATQEGGKLSRAGIGEVVRRRAQAAGVKRPGMHEFRRAFAINYLRNGGDLETLRRLLGHSSMAMVMRYLDLVSDDVRAVHAKASPVSNLRF
jgi:site-specific recombinase XerD